MTDKYFSNNLEQNLQALTAIFNDSSDLIMRELEFGINKVSIVLVYIKGLTSVQQLNESVVKPLMKKYSLQYASDKVESLIPRQ